MYLREKTRQKCELNYEEEILDLFFLPNIILVVEYKQYGMGGSFGTYGGKERYTQDSEKET